MQWWFPVGWFCCTACRHTAQWHKNWKIIQKLKFIVFWIIFGFFGSVHTFLERSKVFDHLLNFCPNVCCHRLPKPLCVAAAVHWGWDCSLAQQPYRSSPPNGFKVKFHEENSRGKRAISCNTHCTLYISARGWYAMIVPFFRTITGLGLGAM